MPLVDHVKEHVRRVGAVREIPDLVDDQDGWMRIGLERLGELPRHETPRRDHRSASAAVVKNGIEAVLNRAVRDGDRQVRFPAARFAEKISDRPSVTKSARERGAEHVQPQRRLIREVEIVDRLQKRKVRAARESPEARLLPMRDLLGDQERQEVVVRPRVALGALHEVAPDAPGIREMQPFEERIEVLIGRAS